MNLTLEMQDLKTIYQVCKKAVAVRDYVPTSQWIKLEIVDNTLTAVALDGFRIHRVSMPLKCENGSILIPLTNLPKMAKTAPVTLSNEGSLAIVDFNGIEQKKFQIPEGKFFDITSAFPKNPPEKVFYLNPHFLKDACEALDGAVVKINYYGDLQPVVLEGEHSASALILPVHPRSTKF